MIVGLVTFKILFYSNIVILGKSFKPGLVISENTYHTVSCFLGKFNVILHQIKTSIMINYIYIWFCKCWLSWEVPICVNILCIDETKRIINVGFYLGIFLLKWFILLQGINSSWR